VPLGECGDGRRPRLRFDLATVAAALSAHRSNDGPRQLGIAAAPTTTGRRRQAHTTVELLPIHGRREAA
jgi:hypothetical protein